MAAAPANLDDTRRRAREVGGELRERVDALEPIVRERMQELEPAVRARWNDLEPMLKDRLEELEPAARQAELGLWRGLRAVFAGLAVLPTLLVRALKALAGAADEATERGQQLGEQALKQRRRRRGITLRRRTLIASVLGAAGVGVAVGWVLGRRGPEGRPDPDEEPFDPRAPLGEGAPSVHAPPVE